MSVSAGLGVALAVLLLAAPASSASPDQVFRISRVVDGDTVDLTNGAKVRLVQIDTPEVYFSPECYGRRASAITKRLLPPGTLVRLAAEPATDRVDRYGRLLQYVTRASRRAQRQRLPRADRSGGSVLLPRPRRALRGAARPPRAPSASASARSLGR